MPDKVPDDWWHLAIEKVPTPICCVSLNGKFLWANLAWLKMLGYGLRELQEMKWTDISLVKDIGADQSSIDLIEDGSVDEYWLTRTYVCRDGTELPVHLYVHRYPLQGKVECFIVSANPNQCKITHDIVLLEQEHDELKEAFFRFVEEVQKTKDKSVTSALILEFKENKVIWIAALSALSFLAGGIWAALRLMMGG